MTHSFAELLSTILKTLTAHFVLFTHPFAEVMVLAFAFDFCTGLGLPVWVADDAGSIRVVLYGVVSLVFAHTVFLPNISINPYQV